MLRILLDSLLSLEKIKENERVNALWRVSKRACKLRQPNMLGIYMYIYYVYTYICIVCMSLQNKLITRNSKGKQLSKIFRCVVFFDVVDVENEMKTH